MYLVCVNICYLAVVVGNDANARVNGCLVLHTCSDERTLCLEERNCLTLHIRAHESTVSVIVLEEGYH